MDLHDFLACSYDVLTLLETIERRQAAIAAGIASLEALADDTMRAAVLTRLRDTHRRADADLDRAAALISKFTALLICS